MAEGAFEERCVEATVRLTHAMSPTVVLLVQAVLLKSGRNWRGNMKNGRLRRSCP